MRGRIFRRARCRFFKTCASLETDVNDALVLVTTTLPTSTDRVSMRSSPQSSHLSFFRSPLQLGRLLHLPRVKFE